MNHDDNIDNIKFDTVVNPTEFETSKLIKKVSDYLTDKVDKNMLNNVIYHIKHKRENTTFNDDVYFDVIQVLTENDNLGIINIDYADLIYQIVKDDNDYSFFLRILPYIINDFAAFKKIYSLFENKNYLIPLFKKMEEIDEYQKENDLDNYNPNFGRGDYYIHNFKIDYRNYFLDDKTYFSFAISCLNKLLNKKSYENGLFKDEKIEEILSKEYDFIELEDNINSISNKIDDTKEVASTTTNNIDDIINKLDTEIDSAKDKLTETIKNNTSNVDDKINELLNKDDGLFNKQKDEVSDLVDTKLEKQKKQKVKEVLEEIKQYLRNNNLCDGSLEIDRIILEELSYLNYTKLKETEAINKYIIEYWAIYNNNAYYLNYYHYGDNNSYWIKILDKNISSKFEPYYYELLLRYNIDVLFSYIDNDMLDELIQMFKILYRKKELFDFDDEFIYGRINIKKIKKAIELFGVEKLIKDIPKKNIEILNEDQLEYYKKILDINPRFDLETPQLIYENEIFTLDEVAHLSIQEQDILKKLLHTQIRKKEEIENISSIHLKNNRRKNNDIIGPLYIDELDSSYKKIINKILETNRGSLYSYYIFELMYIYNNCYYADTSVEKINNIGNEISLQEEVRYYSTMKKYSLDELLEIEKKIGLTLFTKKTEEEQNEIIENIREENNISIELDGLGSGITIGNLKKYRRRIFNQR